MTDDRPQPAEPGTVWTPDTLPLGPLGRAALVGDGGTSAGGTRWPLAYTYVGRDEHDLDVYRVELLVALAPGWTVHVDKVPGRSVLRVAVHS